MHDLKERYGTVDNHYENITSNDRKQDIHTIASPASQEETISPLSVLGDDEPRDLDEFEINPRYNDIGVVTDKSAAQNTQVTVLDKVFETLKDGISIHIPSPYAKCHDTFNQEELAR